mgnify:CR=1 FL=1
MLNVSEETKRAWKNGGAVAFRVLLAGVEIAPADIYEKSLEIQESINDEEALLFVGCIPCGCTIKLRGVDNSIIGQSLEVFAKIGTTEEIKLFNGIIDSAKQDAKREWAEVEAFDKLYTIKNLNVSTWYTSNNFPLTLKQFRDGFFSYLNVSQEQAVLVNDDVLIYETIGGEDITGADIIEAICQLNGVFGLMNREGVFVYKDLAETEEVLQVGEIRSLYYQDFTTSKIDKLQIRESEEDVGAIVGTGSNAYIIEGNFLAYGKSAGELETMAVRLFNKLSNLDYIPTEAYTNGEPFLEVGDIISYSRPEGDNIRSVILARKLSGLVSMADKYTADGVKTYSEAVKSANDSLIQLRGQSNRLTRTVEGLTSEVTTIKGDYASKSQLKQTSDEITAQIESIQSEIDGDISLYYVKEPPTLENYPAWDFTYNIMCNDTVAPHDGLHFEYTEEYYRKNIRALAYDETNNESYRFSKKDGVWGWVEIADTETGVILQRLSTIEMTAESIKTQVQQIETTYATKTELQASVQVSASQILSSVSASYTTKGTTQTMQSQINQQANQISAKVSQTGGSSASFGWSLTANEFKLTATNKAVFVCNSGGITIDGYTKTSDLQANYATIGSVQAKYATIDSLNGVNARFNNLNASNITAGTLSADRLDINGILVNFRGKAVSCGGIDATNAFFNNLYVFDNGTQYSFRRNTATIAGTRINFWGW